MAGDEESPDDEREQRVNRAIVEYLRAEDIGETIDVRAWLALHSDLAPELTAFLDDHAGVDRLTGPLRGADPAATVNWNTASAQPGSAEVPAGDGELWSLGDYEIVDEIGRGGMGVVYRARQCRLNREVALKVILHGGLASAADVQRFRLEAEAVANLDHPNIVPVYEVGQHDGNWFFSMKLVDGGSLSEHLDRFKTDPCASARLVITIARAMHHAHQRGVRHRDLKPSNVLLDQEGEPHVTDFGLAHWDKKSSGLTLPGDILGSPSYMAPEQALGSSGTVTTATDVYGLGAILYALITGHAPFRDDSILATLDRVRDQAPDRPSTLNSRVDRDLETICLKCLEKDAQARYGSADALANDLRRWLAGEPILARRTGALERSRKWAKRRPAVAALLAAVFVVAAVGLGGFFVESRQTRLAYGREARARQRAEVNLYYQLIARAEAELAASQLGRARELLDACRPDLRGWEWDYLGRWLRHGRLPPLRGHASAVTCVAYSRDKSRLASTCFDGTITVWDPARARAVWSRRGHDGPARAVVFHPNGESIATAGHDGVVRIWDVKSGNAIKTFPKQEIQLWSVVYSSDGKQIAAAGGATSIGGRGRAIIWNSEDGRELHTLVGQQGRVWSVAFSPDGHRVATGAEDGIVRVWDSKDARVQLLIQAHSEPVLCVAFSPDGTRLASGGGSVVTVDHGELKIWDAGSGRQVFSLQGHTSQVYDVSFSPDGQRLASASADSSVKVWDLATGLEALTLRGHEAKVRCVRFDRDGVRLASGSEDRTVRIWDASNAPGASDGRDLGHDGAAVWAVAAAPDGHSVASAGEAPAMMLRNPDDDTSPARRIADHVGPVWSVAFSRDSRWLASAGEDHTVKVHDLQAGRLVFDRSRLTGWVRTVAIAPDGRFVASANDYDAKVWDIGTGEERGAFSGHLWIISQVAFSPDGRNLASASWDQSVRIWNLNDPAQPALILGGAGDPGRGHIGRVLGIAFHPNATALASVSDDKTVRLWSLTEGRESRVLTGHAAGINAVAFSHDGRLIASASDDETIRLWDPSSGRELQVLRGHVGRVLTVAFLPGSRRLISSGADGVLKIWPILYGKELTQ